MSDVDQVEQELARTREDLAHTVDQLAAKLDVKSRVQTRVTEVKDDAVHRARELRDRATDDAGKPTPTGLALAGGVAAVVAVVVLVVLRSRRSR